MLEKQLNYIHMNLNEKLENLILDSPEEISVLNKLLEEVKIAGYPIGLQESLLCVLEKNPRFHFGMPGELVRTIEKHYKDPGYENLVVGSIERIPTEYNLWLLNRLLNSYENDDRKERGVALFRKVEQETTDEYVREIVRDFLIDYDD